LSWRGIFELTQNVHRFAVLPLPDPLVKTCWSKLPFTVLGLFFIILPHHARNFVSRSWYSSNTRPVRSSRLNASIQPSAPSSPWCWLHYLMNIHLRIFKDSCYCSVINVHQNCFFAKNNSFCCLSISR
jgi:hypothetical protein